MPLWPAPQPWRSVVARWQRVVILVAGVLCLGTLVWQYGFTEGAEPDRWARAATAVAAVALLVEMLLGSWREPDPRRLLRRRAPALMLLALLVAQLVFVRSGAGAPLLHRLPVGSLTQVYVAIFQIWLVVSLFLEAARVNRRLARLRVRPGRLVLLLFAGLILLGTLALKLPRAVPEGRTLSWVDALFTSTSAVCVTGLVVVDTGEHFTTFGQTVLLVLIQLGGLGIMAVTGFLAVTLGHLGIRERAMLADVLHTDVMVEVGRLLRDLVLVTLALEAIGAVALVGPMRALGADSPWGAAVFHSVSAFCNAGFSTFSDSFVRAVSDPQLNLTVMVLIMTGGLGVPVMTETLRWIRRRAGGRRVPLRVGHRVVWIVSALLWAGGALGLLLLDGGALAALPAGDRVWAAFFQSVSARTAGFNTVETGALGAASLLLLMMWMFIGGAPGSTAGGIKVTTFALMVATVKSMVRGEDNVTMAGRTIARASVREAISVAFVGGLAAAAGLLALLLVESASFLDLAFETVSALCTTGLSTGVTSELGTPGRLVLSALMLVGRIGPLTLVLAVSHGSTVRMEYPTERVVVG